MSIDAPPFVPDLRDRTWGPYAEAFLRLNEPALHELEVVADLAPRRDGLALHLIPGGRAGTIPLRSAQTGHVVGGFVVRPRFGWAGIGRVLTEIGWHASPRFLDLPLVPGSGREIPPWVLAGPVIARMAALLRSLTPGYRFDEVVSQRPRGTILWGRYATTSLPAGRWERIPCRYPELGVNPRLRAYVRWTLERVRGALTAAGGQEPIALSLIAAVVRMLDNLADVAAMRPSRDDLAFWGRTGAWAGTEFRSGIEAISWVVDERGLGGGREMDGLAWSLALEELWESYVESVVRDDARRTGGEVRVGRLGQTTLPIQWRDALHRSLGHLVPDLVVRRDRSVEIIDAKYKAHLAELDEIGWRRFTEDVREAHRADIHQVLAYAALFDAEEVTARLVYPLRRSTYEQLEERGFDRSVAQISHGGRPVRLVLQGLPFGRHAGRTA